VALSWIMLGAGIWAIFYGLSALVGVSVFGLATVGIGCLCLPVPLFEFITGIYATVQGSRMVGAPKAPPSRGIAICLICCILAGDVIAMGSGIVMLVLMSQPDVRAWFESRGLTY